MRRFLKKFLFLITTAILGISVCLTGCSTTTKTTLKAEGFLLGHYDGSDTSQGYDTSMLYKNNSELWGGDSGIIWVSEEEGEALKAKGIVDKNGESYGGYFYHYQSSCGGVASYGLIIDEPNLGRGSVYFVCTRSRDLNDWEICGNVDSGMALFVGEQEWVQEFTWACETVHIPFDAKDTNGNPAPYAGKYFMYFSAKTKKWTPELGELGAIYGNVEGSSIGDGMTCGIAVSDSPAGPFRLVNSENVYGDATKAQPVTKDFLGNDYYGVDDGVNGRGVLTGYNPAVMFEKAGESMGMTDTLTPIDCSPFIDDDGSMYMVFVKHGSSASNAANFAPAVGNNVWGIRMMDPVTPDYSTLRKLVQNGQRESGKGLTTSVVWKGDAKIASGEMTREQALAAYPVWRDYPLGDSECPYEYIDTFPDGTVFESSVDGINDGFIAEAPQLIKTKDGKGNAKYIITYSPCGVGYDWYDVKWAFSNSPLGSYMKPKAEDRYLLGYDQNTSYMTTMGHSQFINTGEEIWFGHWEGDRPHTTNTNPGRIFACSQASWQYAEEYDVYLPIANGPSISLQALPSVATGYTNVASQAKVTASNQIGETLQYVNDGMVISNFNKADKEFAFKKSTVITLTFQTPVSIRGLLIYNSYDIDYAFKNIAHVNFTLAEKPNWYTGSGEGKRCYIDGLGFTPTYISTSGQYTTACTASVATFNEIKVSKIQIEINQPYGANEEIRVSDIVVLGK